MTTCLLLLALASAGALADVGWTELPVHAEARDFGELVLLEGEAHEIYYTVKEPYPFDGVYELYRDHFRDGWIPCSWSSKGWIVYFDSITTPDTLVHRKVQHWIDTERSRLVALILTYRSEGGLPRALPDNDLQQVIVIEYLVQDLQAEVDWLRLECEADITAPNSLMNLALWPVTPLVGRVGLCFW